MVSLLSLRWDAHRKDAPYESEEWAASDRGWLFASVSLLPLGPNRSQGARKELTKCLGHYLDYEHSSSETGRKPAGPGVWCVHAHSCVTRESSWHETPAQAREWLDRQASGREVDYVTEGMGYTHERDAVRDAYKREAPHIAALLDAARSAGWPTAFRDDLTYHDVRALRCMEPKVPFFWCLRDSGTHLYEISTAPMGRSGAGIYEHVWDAPRWMRHFGDACKFYTWDGSRLRAHDVDASKMGEILRDMAHARDRARKAESTVQP